jgi:hypothetical protein
MADAAAGAHGKRPVKIPDEEASKTSKANGTLIAGWFQGLTEFELLEAKEGRKKLPEVQSANCCGRDPNQAFELIPDPRELCGLIVFHTFSKCDPDGMSFDDVNTLLQVYAYLCV